MLRRQERLANTSCRPQTPTTRLKAPAPVLLNRINKAYLGLCQGPIVG